MAMRGDVAGKVALFYPQLNREYRFIAALSARTDATHVLVTYPLFRFFPRGAHALSLWPFDRVRPQATCSPATNATGRPTIRAGCWCLASSPIASGSWCPSCER